MVIRVEQPTHLLTLLFVRQVWGIAPHAVVPDLDPVPLAGGSAMPSSASLEEWTARWERAWERGWAWFEIEGISHQLPTSELLRSLGPEQELKSWFRSMWTTEHGDEGIDRDALADWQRSQRDVHSHPLEAHPER